MHKYPQADPKMHTLLFYSIIGIERKKYGYKEVGFYVVYNYT